MKNNLATLLVVLVLALLYAWMNRYTFLALPTGNDEVYFKVVRANRLTGDCRVYSMRAIKFIGDTTAHW